MSYFNHDTLDSPEEFICTVTCGISIESKAVENLFLITKFQKLTPKVIFYTILLTLMVLYVCFAGILQAYYKQDIIKN